MATPQIRRKPLTDQNSLCDNPLTINTRHGISSTHGSVTIEKLAHSDRQSRSQDATNRKKEKTLCLFLFSFFSSAFILVPPAGLVKGLGATFSNGTTCGGVGVRCARIEVELIFMCYKI